MKLKTPQVLVPVLCMGTNSTGSHRTLWPVGTSASVIHHDDTSDRIEVEMVTKAQAEEVRVTGSLRFSSSDDFYAWLEN